MSVVSEHPDRRVIERGDLFFKEFDSRRARDREIENLRLLREAGVSVPEIVEVSGNRYVTARLPGEAMDEFIRTRWASLPRRERNRLIGRVAGVCKKIRDAGFCWRDLVTYHLFVSPETISVLDPARLRRGKLDLSFLYWSAEEPTVSRSDRLRFWRTYAGSAPPPRILPIGHRVQFRLYRWVHARREPRACPPWSGFVKAGGFDYASPDAVLADPDFRVRRKLADRWNGETDDLVVKITRDPEEARREWRNHRRLLGAGFLVPEPAVGGILSDGRGLFSTRRLRGMGPMDDLFHTLDRRRAVRAVADLARRLHACGFVHKDLYLCHLFVAPGAEEPVLLDLARLVKTTSRRMRKKDLAALCMSARPLCSRTELLRGLYRYGGDKRLARAVLRKAARMERHVPRNVRDGTHVPHVRCTSA